MIPFSNTGILPIGNHTDPICGSGFSGLLNCCRVDGPTMAELGYKCEMYESDCTPAFDIIAALHYKGVALVDTGAQNFMWSGQHPSGTFILVDVDRAVFDASDSIKAKDWEGMKAWKRNTVRPYLYEHLYLVPLCCLPSNKFIHLPFGLIVSLGGLHRCRYSKSPSHCRCIGRPFSKDAMRLS